MYTNRFRPLVSNKEPDYWLLAEEAVDELLESYKTEQVCENRWIPITEHVERYDEGFWDSIKSGWNKLTGRGGGEQQAAAPAKKPAAKKTTTRKTTAKKPAAKKTAAKKPATGKKTGTGKAAPAKKDAPAKKTTAAKKPATTKKTTQKKTTATNEPKKSGGAEQKKSGGKMTTRVVEMGKKYVQKKIGGPEGVSGYIKKNQAGIDKSMQKAPQGVKSAWESIKAVVAAGGKKTLEFCKKHWKAIVIVLVVIVAICLLIKWCNGSGTEAVVNSNTAQSSIQEINDGAKNIASGASDVAKGITPDDLMKSLDSKAQSGVKELFGSIDDADISNGQVGVHWGNMDGLMHDDGKGGLWVNWGGGAEHMDASGNIIDSDGKVISDIQGYLQQLADSDPQHGVLKASMAGNAIHAMQYALKTGAAKVFEHM